MPILADTGIEFSGEPEIFEVHDLIKPLRAPTEIESAIVPNSLGPGSRHYGKP